MADITPGRGARADAGETLERKGIFRERLQHVSWGSIFLGLVLAIGVEILFGLLGMGLGLTILNPVDPMGGIGAWGIGTAIYMVITQIIALFIGGYAASKLAPAFTDQSAMLHGATIWALALIATVWISATTVGLAASGISSAVSGAASTATQSVKAVMPNDMSLPSVDYQSLPEPLKQTLQENGITPDNLQQEVRGAYRDVVSRQQEQRLMEELQQTLQNILQSPTDAPEEVDKAIDDMFGQGGILSEQDMNEMQNSLQRRLNLSDQDVQQITNQLQEAVEQARDSVKEAVATAQEKASQAAKAVTDQIGFIALAMFIASVLGLVAAVFGGKVGENRAARV